MEVLWLIQHPWQSSLALIAFLIFIKTLGDVIWTMVVSKLAQGLAEKGVYQIEITKKMLLVKRKLEKSNGKANKS